ncbi:MAG: extracellular solute-binding protein [Lachnospiraceae bacterium]|nr:extracellular solute-binding protein [Lachnospiraceae bacterium]
MKKSKKFLAVALAATMAVTALAGCKKDKNYAEQVDKITIMVDGTLFTLANGRDQFEARLEELMGVEVDIIQPDHSGYYDTVSQTFANPDTSTWPDVVLLGSTYYATYANSGVLADISDYYENSELKKSGRIINEGLIDGLYINDGLYGISPARGNGCITYVKKAWLDRCGLTAPTTYAEYIAMLDAFMKGDPDGNGVNGDTPYAVTSAGIVNAEAPYVNYLPEFFQDAYPDFYQKADGTWVDGFTEQAMIDAINRLTDAYAKGYLDPELVTNGTKDCRNKFFEDKCGVFTYWAGNWANTLATNLEAKGLDSELVNLEPIAEVGNYIERQATVWCVTSACENPEAVFNLFFGTMLDGADGQQLWTYGVEDVHWSTKAETNVINAGLETEKKYVSEEGQFHWKTNLETGAALYSKAHIDKLLAITTFADPAKDVGNADVNPRITASAKVFNENSVLAPVITSNDVMEQYQSGIMSLRIQLVSECVTNGLSVTDAMARYNAEVGTQVKAILDSLNK